MKKRPELNPVLNIGRPFVEQNTNSPRLWFPKVKTEWDI